VIRPVQVFEDEHERSLVGEALEEAAPGRECLLPPVASAPRIGCETDERPQMGFDPTVVDGLPQLARRLLLGLAFEDPRVRLHHFAKRPERDAVAIRQAAPVAPKRDLSLLLDVAVELEDEPALADPWDAHERHELRGTLLPCEGEGSLQ